MKTFTNRNDIAEYVGGLWLDNVYNRTVTFIEGKLFGLYKNDTLVGYAETEYTPGVFRYVPATNP